jgi:hypothetical protein
VHTQVPSLIGKPLRLRQIVIARKLAAPLALAVHPEQLMWIADELHQLRQDLRRLRVRQQNLPARVVLQHRNAKAAQRIAAARAPLQSPERTVVPMTALRANADERACPRAVHQDRGQNPLAAAADNLAAVADDKVSGAQT